MTKMKRRRFAVVVVFIFVMIFFGFALFRYVPPLLFKMVIKSLKAPQAPPEELFRQYVLSPIPKSVTNIKADQPRNFRGYICTFRFNISRDDLTLLIDSRPFVEVWHVKYKDGNFEWGLGNAGFIDLKIAKYAHSMPLYGNNWDSPREPKWFKPGRWKNPEAYAFYKVGDLVNIQVFEHDVERDGGISGGRVTIKVLLYNEKEGEAYFIVSSRENK